MKKTGKRWIPVAYMLLWFLINCGYSSEIVFYSPEEAQRITNRLRDFLQSQAPHRQYLFLVDQWNLKDTETSKVLQQIRIPCSITDERRFILEKNFSLNKKNGQTYLLHIGEANGIAEIRLNDKLIYDDQKNYLPLSLPLDAQLLKSGQNKLEIVIERTSLRFRETPGFLPINLPSIDTGIFSPIYLEIRPPIYLQSIEATHSWQDSLFTVSAEISFKNNLPSTAGYRLRVRYISGNEEVFRQSFAIDALTDVKIQAAEWVSDTIDAWNPQKPTRFRIEASIDSGTQTIDRVRRGVAIRSYHIKSKDFLVNYQPLQVNGINYIYQNIDGSELFDADLVRKDLQDIKNRGFNAVRVISRPLPEQFYKICEEMGLLCFQDLPFIFASRQVARQHEVIFERWREYYNHLRRLARRYSSVAAIGLAFYIDGQSQLQQALFRRFRQLLPISPVPLYASTWIPTPDLSKIIDFQIVDIVKRHPLGTILTEINARYKDRLFFPSGYTKPLSFQQQSMQQSTLFRQNYRFYQTIEQNKLGAAQSGHFILTYNDYYSFLSSLQNGANNKYSYNQVGLVDLHRQPRDLSGHSYANSQDIPDSDLTVLYQTSGAHTFLYILIGIINIFLFLISYKRYRILRQNLHYSIKKPHGFFTSLQERIIIPYKQSFFLLFVIAVNGAIIYSSIAYFYRTNLVVDYLLSIICYIPQLKLVMTHLIWNQPLFLAVGTLVIMVFFFFLAILIKILSFFGSTKVMFNQALAVSIWSASPFVFLLPLSIFMYTILLTMKSYWIPIAVLLYFHVWGYLRWINGARVLTERLYSRVFIGMTLLLILIAAGIGAIYQNYFNSWEYLQQIYHLYTLKLTS